ncbi:MAG: DUF4136 domain-containing protein [Polymorphobacter sp.]
MRVSILRAALPLAAVLALAGCMSNSGTEVTRFHLGQPIPSDAIALVPGPGADAKSLEFRRYAAIVAADLDRAGLHPAGDDGRSAYVGVLNAQQTVRQGAPKASPFSIGFGGGSGGFGGGVSVPVGTARTGDVRINLLALQIRRRSDQSMVWEGRAVQEIAADAPASALPAALPELSRALLSGFPGPNGQTVKVKPGK